MNEGPGSQQRDVWKDEVNCTCQKQREETNKKRKIKRERKNREAYQGASSEMCGRMRKRVLPRLLVPDRLLDM
jgi:hypothetical protein